MKKIKIVLQQQVDCAYRIDSMTNAAVIEFRASPYIVGSVIDPRWADEFARDRRWEVTIKAVGR